MCEERRENKGWGERELYSEAKSLDAEKKKSKKSVNECVFLAGFPMAIYSPVRHWGLSGVHTQSAGEKNKT